MPLKERNEKIVLTLVQKVKLFYKSIKPEKGEFLKKKTGKYILYKFLKISGSFTINRFFTNI